jgi:hypothetical protein
MANAGDIISKVAVFGVAGWLAENAVCQQARYSTILRGAKIPFLPVYAANGVVLTAVAPWVSKWPWVARGLVYAALGTGVEYVGCQIDRHLLDGQQAFGSSDALANLSTGCVNFTRSALWAGMGLIAERVD